jgi:hypothetical protein
MTDTTSPALRTWLAYYQAWTSHDLEKAMSYIADGRRGVPRFPGPGPADPYRLENDRGLR